MNDDLALAHRLADAADAITLPAFERASFAASLKADQTVVTDADRGAEQAIRDLIAAQRPTDAVHGEELEDAGAGTRRWIIDPIDGTANYVRGVPIWATLIALMVDGETCLGVVSAPVLGRRWWALQGEGAWSRVGAGAATRLHVSGVTSLPDAFVSYASLGGWAKAGRGRQFLDLLGGCGRTRGFGDFYSYMLVAQGAVDIATEPDLALHDMAALDVIVREAGGAFTNLDGRPGPVGPGALATNGHLHEVVLKALNAG